VTVATYSGAASQHQTLAATVVDTVTLDADYDYVEVLNRASSGDIYFRVDGTAPTVAGAGCYVVQPGQSLQVLVKSPGNTVVKLISSATPPYSVTGVA
jgi:hypothetical protein